MFLLLFLFCFLRYNFYCIYWERFGNIYLLIRKFLKSAQNYDSWPWSRLCLDEVHAKFVIQHRICNHVDVATDAQHPTLSFLSVFVYSGTPWNTSQLLCRAPYLKRLTTLKLHGGNIRSYKYFLKKKDIVEIQYFYYLKMVSFLALILLIYPIWSAHLQQLPSLYK